MSTRKEPAKDSAEALHQLIDIVVQGRWWILSAMLVISLVAVPIVMRLPDRYTAEAMLVLVQPQITSRYVDPLTSMSNMDTVMGMQHEILSTARLVEVIRSVDGLFDPEDMERLRPDQLSARLKRDIDTSFIGPQGPGRDPNTFTISFTATTPKLAYEVTSRLAAMFIEENIKTRENRAGATASFLSDRLASAQEKLTEQEQKLRDFKMRNSGELPEQQQANLGALTDLRIQLQNTTANLTRSQQQLKSAESALETRLTRVQSERTELLARLTPRHPDILKKDHEIEAIAALLARSRNGSAAAAPATTALEDPVMTQLKSQIESSVADITSLSDQERRLRSEIASYQGRLRLAPVREQELTVLLRDYELLKQDYSDLQTKQTRAQLTVSAEERHGGQQFRMVEPPTMPISPSGPGRLKLTVGASLLGLALGGALAFLKGMRDQSFRGEEDLKHQFPISLIVSLPVIRTPSEERSLKWHRIIDWGGAAAVIVVVAAVQVYVFQNG